MPTDKKYDSFSTKRKQKPALLHQNLNAQIIHGDCREQLKLIGSNAIYLIVTSPPYADARRTTYGGISPNDYVDWFLPIAEELCRALKPTGSFILNFKERVVSGERHTYVIELIIAMKIIGWLWTEEYIWHKKIRTLESGPTDFEIVGSACYTSIYKRNFSWIKSQSWFL